MINIGPYMPSATYTIILILLSIDFVLLPLIIGKILKKSSKKLIIFFS